MLSSRVKRSVIAIMLAAAASCGTVRQNNEARGDSYYRKGYYDDSLAEYLMAEKTQGVSAPLLRKIGKVYVMKGDFSQAKSYFDRYFSARDSTPDAEVLLDYLQISVDRAKAGDTTTMVHALEEILHLDPAYNLGRYYFDLGEFYYNQPDYRKAIAYFLRGLPFQVELENRAEYLFHLALSYEKLEDNFDAYLYFDQYLTLYPDSPDVDQARWHRGSCSYPLAQQMYKEGELEQAFFYLQQIINASQPQHLVDDAYFLQGEILISDSRPEEAKQAYRQVLKLNRYYYKEKIAEQARKRVEEIEFKQKDSN